LPRRGGTSSCGWIRATHSLLGLLILPGTLSAILTAALLGGGAGGGGEPATALAIGLIGVFAAVLTPLAIALLNWLGLWDEERHTYASLACRCPYPHIWGM
jgi:hypothetical protein